MFDYLRLIVGCALLITTMLTFFATIVSLIKPKWAGGSAGKADVHERPYKENGVTEQDQ